MNFFPKNAGLSEQSKVGKHRLKDADVLFEQNRFRGAMYLAGYAIECALKAKLMQMFCCLHLNDLEHELREKNLLLERETIYTHQLERLLRLTQAMERVQKNREVWKVFLTVNRWIPGWRYSPLFTSPEDAADFLVAVKTFHHWIEHNL